MLCLFSSGISSTNTSSLSSIVCPAVLVDGAIVVVVSSGPVLLIDGIRDDMFSWFLRELSGAVSLSVASLTASFGTSCILLPLVLSFFLSYVSSSNTLFFLSVVCLSVMVDGVVVVLAPLGPKLLESSTV